MLRPTFLSFETARKSIVAAQYGLDTVGHNMSNQNTPGYTRQRVDQVSFALNPRSRYSIYGQQLPGQGTLVTGINRVRDPYLDNRFRIEATEYGELGVKSQALKDINTVFDEIESDGLHAVFSELSEAFSNLGTDFSSSSNKLVARTVSEQVADIIRTYANDLNTVEQQQASDLSAEITGLSEILEKISFYNEKIEQQHVYGNPANELMDERDMLIDELAAMTDITVTYQSVTISEERSIERLVIKMNGPDSNINLVDGKKHAKFEVVEGATDPYTVKMIDSDGFVRQNANRLFEKGTVKGYLDILNGKGNFAVAGENTQRGIPYFRASLDSFVQTFADTMNWLNAGSPMQAPPNDSQPAIPAPGTSTNLFTYNASNPSSTLTISQQWRDSLDHLRTHTDADDPNDPNNPEYVLKFAQALNLTSYNFPDGAIGGSNTYIKGTFQEFLVSFEALMGQDQKLTDTKLDGAELNLASLLDNRDAVTAVSANEESVNMMMYQNFYNAALRYMTTLDEAVNQIINSMGLVGR